MLPLGCGPWRAASALSAVSIETSGGYDNTDQSCDDCVALVGQQQPRPLEAAFASVLHR